MQKVEKHIEKLDIIDEQENIIDQVSRNEVHTKGLLHREVHVWLHTPDNRIIFQKRSATKDTFPNLLDASVGGHVDLGKTPEIASVKELEEEAGITVDISELNFIDKKRSDSTDPQTGKINNVIRYIYSYLYTGDIADLTLEEGKGDGFVAYSISELENLDEEARKEFIPRMISRENIEMYKNIVMKKISIEYAHIYTNSEIENEHKLAISYLKPYSNEENSLVVMIDDYSFPDPTFDYKKFSNWLIENNSKPNLVVRESQLIPDCDYVLSLVEDDETKNNLVSYIKKGKYPCSLFIATWYLIRLGCIESDIFPQQEQALKLLNILPESFKPYEEKGLSII